MNKKQYALMNWEQIESIVYSDCANPSSILGLHTRKKEVILQAFFPEAVKVYANLTNAETKRTKKVEMELVDESGFFAVFLTKEKFTSYTYTIEYANAEKKNVKDPYSFSIPTDDKAIASIRRGTNECMAELFGAKCTEIDNTKGVLFTLYAPKAKSVSLLGDFNNFHEGHHLMEKNESAGVFALFVPGAEEGCRYRFSVRGKGVKSIEKADPMAFCQDGADSIVVGSLAKTEGKKTSDRPRNVWLKNPMHIYEVDLFSLMDEKTKSILDLLPVLLKHCREYSYTGLHLLGIFDPAEEAHDRQHIHGIYAVSERLGGPSVFASFVDEIHNAGLSISVDFPIAFFDAGEEGLHFFDGEALFESPDERIMHKPTFNAFAFDFGSGYVQSYLLSAALYLIETYRIDGFRIPNLGALLYLDYGKKNGEWVPNEYGGNLNLAGVRFLKKLNSKIAKKYPNFTKIASSDGVLINVTTKSGKDSMLFDMVYHSGFESSVTSFLQNDPFYRNEHYYEFAELVKFAFGEEFILPYSSTVSSKDYVSMLMRMPGTIEDKVRNVVLANAFLAVFPGRKCSFMGTDNFCEEAYFANPYASALKEPRYLQRKIACIRDLFALYHDKAILHPENESTKNFELVKSDDPADNVLIFKRTDEKNTGYIIFNFSNHAMEKYSFGLPEAGKIKEFFTTDDPAYTDDGVINKNAIATKEIPMDGYEQSVTVKIPAMGMQIFSYRPFTEKELKEIEKKKYDEKVRYVEKTKREYEEEKNRIIAQAVKDAETRKKEIEDEKNRIIDEATKEAARKIKELQKILKK